MKNHIQSCSHNVPENSYGVFVMHSIDNQPLSDPDLKGVIAGPVASAEAKLRTELAKPLHLAEGGQSGNAN
jgi:hypothetical protein